MLTEHGAAIVRSPMTVAWSRAVPLPASKLAASRYQRRGSSGVPHPSTIGSPPSPNRSSGVPSSAISNPKPVQALSLQVPRIACRRAPGSVGHTIACKVKLSSCSISGVGGTTANEPACSGCACAGSVRSNGGSSGSVRNGGASDPACGLSTRTIRARYCAAPAQLVQKPIVSPGRTLIASA